MFNSKLLNYQRIVFWCIMLNENRNKMLEIELFLATLIQMDKLDGNCGGNIAQKDILATLCFIFLGNTYNR